MKKLYNKVNEFWLRSRKWSNENILGYITGAIVKLILIIIFAVLIYSAFESISSNQEDFYSNDYNNEQNDCNVIGINLHGTLYTYLPLHADGDITFDYDSVASEDIMGLIDNANKDPNIRAIIIEVNSNGGSPVGGEEIAEEIKNSEKPVVAFIRDIGASSAYWAISSADRIWASKNSDVGSIGITMSYLNEVELNKKNGYTWEQLSSGKFKDSGSADKILTKEERDLFMRDVKIMYENFMEVISENRNIPIEKVREISDGSTVLGEKAKELGLIDEIGGINQVEQYLEDKIGEKIEVCWE